MRRWIEHFACALLLVSIMPLLTLDGNVTEGRLDL